MRLREIGRPAIREKWTPAVSGVEARKTGLVIDSIYREGREIEL